MTTKILVPVDGSEHSKRAIEHVIQNQRDDGELDIHLLTVPIAVDSGHARMFVSHEELDAYYREEGLTALKEARAQLDQAGIDYTYHIAPGHVADTIARFAEEREIDKIVMGTHGRGELTHLLMGSVATDVFRRSKVPVTLVK
jgi:nucleotide-binding universal stress UspA family protein